MELGRIRGGLELGKDGIIYFHKPVRKLLNRFTLPPSHGMILREILFRVLLVCPLNLEGIFKGLIAQDRVIWEVLVPFYYFFSKTLGK